MKTATITYTDDRTLPTRGAARAEWLEIGHSALGAGPALEDGGFRYEAAGAGGVYFRWSLVTFTKWL